MASLRLTTSMNGATVAIIGAGDLTRGTSSALLDAVDIAVHRAATAIVIDLREVTPEPIAAAEALGAVASKAVEAGIRVQLCAGDAVRDAIQAGRTLALFTAIDEAVGVAGSLEHVLNECADVTPFNSHDAEVTWITTDETKDGTEAS